MAEVKKHYPTRLVAVKAATARVRLMTGKGNITVNGKPAAEYFDGSKFIATRT